MEIKRLDDIEEADENIITKAILMPVLSLNMEHKIILSDKQKALLLEERKSIIEECLGSLQSNFLRIGQALGEIRKFRLYKMDPLYKTWSSFIRNRLTYKLHQSTITDYIGIVKMQEENSDFMSESDVVSLGYKKAKLLKSKLSIASKEEDISIKEKLRSALREFYKQSFKELKDIPYTTYIKALDDRIGQIKKIDTDNSSFVIQKTNNFCTYKLDKKRNKITIALNKDSTKDMDKIFSIISQTLENALP